MQGTPVDSYSCPVLPCQFSTYPEKLPSVNCPWRNHRHSDVRLGLHFKFSPATAAVAGHKGSSHTVGGKRANTTRAQAELEEAPRDLPSLPYTSNQSLSVESWGSVYTGPHEAKYWNSNRNFPYPVGFTSIKTYKGSTYLQKIEEGAEGPVFIIEIIGKNKTFSSKSPQKVWNDVVEGDGQRVQGARHFGFQSHDVITALKTLPQYQSEHSSKESIAETIDLRVTGSTSNNNKNIVERLNSDNNDDFALIENIFDDESDEEHLAGFEGEMDEDVLEKDGDVVDKGTKTLAAKLEHDEGMKDGEDEEEEEDENEDVEDDSIEEDILQNVEDHHANANHGHHLSSDDDDDDDEVDDHDVEEEEEEEEEEDDDDDDDEEEDDNDRDALSYDEYPTNRRVHIDVDSPAFVDTGPLLNTFRSTRSESSFEKFERLDSIDESYKDDVGAINNNIYYPSDQGRSKVVGRVWRKGDSIVSHGKQQGMDRPGNEQHHPLSDGSQSRASMGSSFNTRPWDASSGKKREENTRSSQMLLELLQKWNKTRKWNRDLKASPQSRAESKSLELRADNEPHQDVTWGDERVYPAMKKAINQNRVPEINPFYSRGNLSSKNHESQETMRAMQFSSENGELALDQFKIDDNVDESTDFAITKLFETIGKKDTLSSGSENPPRLGKMSANVGHRTVNHVEKSWIRGGVGKPLDMEEHQMRLKVADDTKFYRESGDVGKRSKENTQVEPEPLFQVEKKAVDGNVLLASKGKHLGHKSTRLSTMGAPRFDETQVEEMRLIDNVRKLVVSKHFEDAFLAMKSAKLTNAELNVDVYESLLGDLQLTTWQKEVFKYVQDGNSVLVSAPSGAGKTVAADCCIFQNYIEEHRTLFVTPSDHLAKEKMHTLGNIFGHSHVGGLTTKMQKDHKVVVLTLEALAKMLQELHGPGGSEFRFFFEGINMVVLDKLHTLGDSKYTNLWEVVFMLMDAKIKVLALTLPASNEDQIVSWINMRRRPCKLVSCKTEPIMKRYFFCNANGMFPLLDTDGVKLREDLLKSSEGYRNSMNKDQLNSFFLFGYDKPSLSQALVLLRSNAMLPALVVFPNVVGCNEAMQDASAALEDYLLSDQELATLEARCIESKDTHPDLIKHLEQADQEALRRGFAACHECKLPAWQAFVLKLFQENILKLLLVSENVIFHMGVTARTIILPATCSIMKEGVLPLSAMQALPLFGSAGRRGYDVEGNVIFLQTYMSGPSEAASLALKKDLDIVSHFRPSYSLVVNLMAKYQIAKVKELLSGTFHDVVYYHKHAKEKLLHIVGEKILNCLESKGDLEIRLFQRLAEINKQKLADAAVFTRVDIRLTMRSASHGGNVFPGFLLAVVPEKTDSFYMVFGADNNFHLLPAGALDHVYGTESPPLDVLYKQSTGQTLRPPAIPPKEMWNIEHDGTGSYVATGNSQTEWYVKLLMDYPVHMSAVKEGLQLRKEIFSLDSEILSLMEKRMDFRTRQFGDVRLSGLHEVIGNSVDELNESDTWKEAMRLLKIMVQADALLLTDNQGVYVKLNPLGMLISRLHNVDNELWLAMALTLSCVRQLQPSEFIAIIAATIPLEMDVENLSNDQRDLTYRATKPMKTAFTKLELIRKQVATLQGCLNPPLHLTTPIAGIVYAWTRSKPGPSGFNLENINDGEVAWKLKCVRRRADLINRACTEVSVDISEPNDFSSLSMLAKKAEELLAKHLGVVD